MNFKFRHTEKIVGMFVLVALIILMAGIVILAMSKKLFVETHVFHTRLSDATGLSTSTSLNFKGYEIGRVSSFFLDEENNIDVELALYGEFLPKIVNGCAIYRQSNPITGETSLVLLMPLRYSIKPGPGKKPALGFQLPEGAYIPSLDMAEGQRLLEEHLVEKSGDSVSIIFDEAEAFFSNLRSEFKLKKDSFRTFFSNLGDFSDSLAQNRAMFAHFEQLLNPKNGPVFATMDRLAQFADGLLKNTEQLKALLDNYKNPDGLVLKLIQMDKRQLDETMQNLNNNLLVLQKTLEELKGQSPMLAEVLEKARKTLEAINNNPLLRGGISSSEQGRDSNASKKKRVDIDE